MDRSKLDYFTKLILEERERIIESMSSFGRDFRDAMPKASEYGEDASLGEKKEFLTRLLDLETEELREVNDALRRIIDGTYGICANCGSEIPDERLEALPTTKLCVNCKRLEEERAMAKEGRRSPWRLVLAAEGPRTSPWDEEDDALGLP